VRVEPPVLISYWWNSLFK